MATTPDVATASADPSGVLAWAAACRKRNEVMRVFEDIVGDGLPATQLWTCSLLLLRHLERDASLAWRGTRVLELGSGAGHLAVGLSRLGAHVIATEGGARFGTRDANPYATLCAWTRHLQAERPPNALGGTLALRELAWGDDDGVGDDAALRTADVVLMCEVVYDISAHDALLATLRRVLTSPSQVCYSMFADRPFSLGFMILLDDDGTFEVEQLEPAELLGMEEDEVLHMHRIRRRSGVDVPG